MGALAKFSYKDKLLYWIIILLGCNQFPVIRIGGSFKIYEFLGLMLIAYKLFETSKMKPLRRNTFYALIFFIIIPVANDIYSRIFLDYPYGFFARYASSKYLDSFRFDYYFFPMLQLLLLAINYFAFTALESSWGIYENFDTVIKGIVFVGTFIAIYSIFALYVIDPIPLLPGFIQNKNSFIGRTGGFSQEPGTYVFYQGWVCFFLYYSKRLYKKQVWYFLALVNFIALILTLSSTLVGYFLSIALGFFIFKGTESQKRKLAFYVLFTIIFFYLVVIIFDLQKLVAGVSVNKIQDFFSGKGNDNTISSGATRAYTTGIGYRIFFDYPVFGVGQGRSQYYMYLYEFKMGIRRFGERLIPGTIPMGVLPLVMADEGSIGLIALCVFYFSIIWKFWLNRNKSDYHKMFLMGGLFLFVFFFTLFPVYHMFFWAYLGMGLGYIRYFDKKMAMNK